MLRTGIILRSAIVSLVLISSTLAVPQKKPKNDRKEKAAGLPAVIWRAPGDPSSLNLVYGIGGQQDAPDPNGKYTFVKEDMEGTSPKFDVTDEQGIRWRVKLGDEPQAETAATRLLWAAGYFVDEDYYLPEVKVENLPKLRRGEQFVSDGVVHGARLERRMKEVKKIGNWDWFDNPFANTRELNGLRVMMSLLNNWDLKTDNNSIYEVDGERRYVVSDVGATFGKTGNTVTRSKSVPDDYAKSKFISKTTPGYIDFTLHSRPLFITAVDVSNYETRSKMDKVTDHIPRADAKWLGQILSQLYVDQIRDCFRAAGYTPEEVEEYTKVVQGRIADLNAL
jgi:hypothetical protein